MHRLQLIRREAKMDKVIKIVHGHKVVEVCYNEVDKGRALRSLLAEKQANGNDSFTVLAVGDDRSDETMFSAAPQDSLTIKVGHGQTEARLRVDCPSDVRQLLWQIVSHVA